MKKFLFTLCAVLVGLTASANAHYTLGWADADGNPVTEITAAPGTEVTVHLQLLALDQICKGHQMEFIITDAEGARINNDGVVALKGVKPNPFSAAKYFTPEGMATFGANASAESLNGDGEINYRILGSNTTDNMFFVPAEAAAAQYGMSVDDIVAYYGAAVQFGNIYGMTITIGEGWDEDFATLALTQAYTKLAIEPITEQKLDADLTLKINNANATPVVTLAEPVISFEQTDDLTMKVTVTCATEGASLIVNGENVGLAPYSYTVYRESVYEAKTVNVTAKSVLGDETSAEVTGSKAFEPVQQKTKPDAPTYEVEDFDTYVQVTVTYYGDGTKVLFNTDTEANLQNPFTVNKTYEPQTYSFTAYNEEGPTMLQSYILNATIDIPAMQKPYWDPAPAIQFVETKNANDEVVSVEVVVTNYDTYTVKVDGQPYRGEVIYANYTAPKEIVVDAVKNADATHLETTAHGEYTLNKLNQIPSAAPNIYTTMDDNYVYVWANSEAGTVTLYDENGQEVDPQPLKLPRNEYSAEGADYRVVVSATNQQEGEQYAPTSDTKSILVPMKEQVTPPTPTEKTGSPVFRGYTTDGIHAYYVEINNAPGFENATIYYTVTKDGVLLTDETHPDGIYTYEEVLSFTEDGSYRVEAYAVADGYLPSDPIGYEFVVSETTGLVDVLNGKTIANVRYFNMAGQEMQEANGMTIVVTTYTDGTTNSVKVLK